METRNELIIDALHQAKAMKLESIHAEIYTVDNFFNIDYCKMVIKSCKNNFIRSQVLTDEGKATREIRTSSTCKLSLCDPRISKQTEDKIYKFLLGQASPEDDQIQIQHYKRGQFYREHFDWIPPWRKHNNLANTKGQRSWTIMIYLNDVEKGGETRFRYLNHSFYPKAGMAVIWNNLKRDGQPNPFTLHEAKPVLKGNKWILTKWLRHKKGTA